MQIQMQHSTLSSSSPTMINTTHLARLVILLLLFLESLQIASADEQLIHTVCKETPSPDACESILLADPRGVLSHTRKDLAIVAVDATISAATSANRNAGYMAGQYSGSPQGEPLAQCEQLYLMLVIDLQSVKAMLKSGVDLMDISALLLGLIGYKIVQFALKSVCTNMKASRMDLKANQTVFEPIKSNVSSFEEAYQAASDVWKIPDACDNEFATRRLSSLLKRRNKELNQKISLCVNLAYQMIDEGHY